ncbi:MAG: glycosyltransferase family 2 protein [Bacteroidales bacterium]|nr:glycosyltransferase family 2 protein [Bacteroidales bacterium]
MSPKIAIVIVNYNGLNDTQKCLQSLHCQSQAVDIIVVDNASTEDPSQQLCAQFPWITFIQAGVNGGWAGGNNAGICHAMQLGVDWIILLNNDTVVASDFVDRLSAAATVNSEYGILGPVIRYMDPPCAIQTEGVRFNQTSQAGFFQHQSVPLTVAEKPLIVDVDIVNGCCLMLHRSVVEKIGLIDEKYFLIHEESDLCLRAQEAGFKLGVLSEALVWHKGSSSFQREGKRLQRYFDARNLVRLILRHGNSARYPLRRSLLHSLLHHMRYSFHRYSAEREAGYLSSANAVIEGLYDALLGRYGPYRQRNRPGIFALHRIFAAAWWLKRGQIRVDPTAISS